MHDERSGPPTIMLPGTWQEHDAQPDPWAGVAQAPPVAGPSARFRQIVTGTDRRGLIAAVVVVPLVAVVAAVTLLPDPPDFPAAAPPGPSPSAAASEPAPVTSSAPSGDLEAISAERTAELLAGAGLAMTGELDQAWTYSDANGLNLLVNTVETVGPRNHTMRVQLYTDVDGQARDLARLADAGLPGCGVAPAGHAARADRGKGKGKGNGRGNGNSGGQPNPNPTVIPDPGPVDPDDLPDPDQSGGGEFGDAGGQWSAGFTSDSVTLSDVDGDGVGEVTVGWSSSCGADPAVSRVTLVTLAGERVFSIRGEGVIGSGSGSVMPEPDGTTWPTGYLDRATELFHSLYF